MRMRVALLELPMCGTTMTLRNARIGSALDIFGGTSIRYEDVVKFNRSLGA